MAPQSHRNWLASNASAEGAGKQRAVSREGEQLSLSSRIGGALRTVGSQSKTRPYVPCCQLWRYSCCSFERVSIVLPIDLSLRVAIWRSISSGTSYTAGARPFCNAIHSAASACVAKLISITDAG